ncbi:hypothetical protein [Pantoea sp. BAV 3049]|nr:hypothetical protein [Pantoea sp. BAV 3049]
MKNTPLIAALFVVTLVALLPDLLPLPGLAVVVMGIGLKSYRKTLD